MYCDVAEATKSLEVGVLVKRTGPGSGNMRFCSPMVAQVPEMSPMLATNMLGRADMPEVSDAPPLISIAAQFIYISRFPTVLNQVHARVA